MIKGKVPTYEEFLAQHSAGLRAQGFDEQFACFVVHLLTLKADESISYEKEDDIVITKKNGEKIFIQVKNSADTPVRKMTTADTDFWKTLKLWVDGYNHYTAPDKNKYFENRQFLIATNMAVENGFYCKIEEFQKQLTDIKGLREVYVVAKAVSRKPITRMNIPWNKEKMREDGIGSCIIRPC